MEILFDHKFSKQPLLSIVLIDWSVRDSCHILEYLNHQDVSRELYEIIWIEYYDKRWRDIEIGLRKSAVLGTHPVIDKWIVMGMPHEAYYHKHLMYNVGIAIGSGTIICLCDSDALVKPTFVKSVIESFNKDNNIVLHMDELRSNNRKFYPFSYPSFEEIVTSGINALDNKPKGLVNMSAPDKIHRLNYGACMCALREDLINIGGADEHVDYLGHICGPYEMTFRLVNYGKKEFWHHNEWLYHTWHPGESGKGNYRGPHDGYLVSTTALEIIKSGRIMPLVENPAIRMLRQSEKEEVYYTPTLSQIIPELEIEKWNADIAKWSSKKYWIGGVIVRVKEWAVEKRQQYLLFKQVTDPFCHPGIYMKPFLVSFRLFKIIFIMIIKQTRVKVTAFSAGHFEFVKTPEGLWNKIHIVYGFFRRMREHNRYIVELCRQCLGKLVSYGVKEAVIYGVGDVARILLILTFEIPLKIEAVYDDNGIKRFSRFKVLPAEALAEYKGKVIIGSLVGVEDRVRKLKEIGIDEERMVIL